jgi:hypothetical protein
MTTPSQRSNPLYGQHNAYRQNDEYFCPRCKKRWAVSEDAPDDCV